MAWPPGATTVYTWSQEWRVPDLEAAGKHRDRRGQAGFLEEETSELSPKEVKRRQDEEQAPDRPPLGPGGPHLRTHGRGLP